MHIMTIKLSDTKLVLLLFAITIATRIPFASTMLYHLDSVQYALGIDRYDVAVHQPHPPGYFLYVMLGKLVNTVTHDPNRAFVALSILFSGLAVITIFQLGRELFDRQTALFAALLALTSPNLWFHGEVAMNYVIEAFTSSAIALLCWQVARGREDRIWLLAAVLALAGGIRQNTPVFLLPLVLYSVRNVPIKKITAAVLLCAGITLCWVIPMVLMTGGLNEYIGAFQELWKFNTGHNSAFEKGLTALALCSRALFNFITLSIGGGVVLLGLNLYYFLRKRHFAPFWSEQARFIALWMTPTLLFYLLIFIHPANPGYVLIILPPLLLLTAQSVVNLTDRLGLIGTPAVAILLAINLYLFFGTAYPVTARAVSEHDQKLATIVSRLGSHDPSRTALFVGPYIFLGFRQVMYYLPEFPVIEPTATRGPNGELRKLFWGQGRQTMASERVAIPRRVTEFATLVHRDYQEILNVPGITVNEIYPGAYIASGPIELVHTVYPKLGNRIELATPALGQDDTARVSLLAKRDGKQ